MGGDQSAALLAAQKSSHLLRIAWLQITGLAQLFLCTLLLLLKTVPQVSTLKLDLATFEFFEALRSTSMSLHLRHDLSMEPQAFNRTPRVTPALFHRVRKSTTWISQPRVLLHYPYPASPMILAWLSPLATHVVQAP